MKSALSNRALVVAALIAASACQLAPAAPTTTQPSTERTELPADLPLPAAPPNEALWLREACILQPVGHSQFVAITQAASRAAQLREEFGFNAIIVQPPDSHNTMVADSDKLSEEQFHAGLDAYRAAGYRIMLYTSLMALGLSPEFQSGEIARRHPDWLQRDPRGNHVLVWGVPWLCPSTGARQAALDRCVRIVAEYDADGVMLDNNQFFKAEAGWTCHCDACRQAFREYISTRFGDEESSRLFGAAPQAIEIPTEPGPVFALWVHWRNRVWADVNDSFRTQLRKARPDLLFFANTQYAFDDGMLAADEQYEREDVVLSESVQLAPAALSQKLIVGHALAAGRPLWNYVGTFSNAANYTGLLSPEQIGPAIAATLAHNARPWIVEGFDEGQTDPDSRRLMSTLLAWHARNPVLFNNPSCAVVAAVVSPTSRDLLRAPLMPGHLDALRSAGVSVVALRDDRITPRQLEPLRVITIESAGCLPESSAKAIADWVRRGGTLIAGEESGAYDELGRKRTPSVLWNSLGLESAPATPTAVGRGSAIAPAAGEFAATAAHTCQPYAFFAAPNPDAALVAYQSADALLLHVVRMQPSDQPMTLRIPKQFSPSLAEARLHAPGQDAPQPLSLESRSDGVMLTLSTLPLYCVVELRHD